jgi:phosphoenolpyruvate carboxylase
VWGCGKGLTTHARTGSTGQGGWHTRQAGGCGAFNFAQGETLEQQFGEKESCFRTLDLYTSAVLESSLNPVKPPLKQFREAMGSMAKVRSISHTP